MGRYLLANHFLIDTKENGFEGFSKRFAEHSDEINNYIKGEMFPYMDSIPFLN